MVVLNQESLKTETLPGKIQETWIDINGHHVRLEKQKKVKNYLYHIHADLLSTKLGSRTENWTIFDSQYNCIVK